MTYSAKAYEQMAEVSKAMANPKRLEILNTIDDKEVTVNDLSKALHVRKSNTSQHLKILRLMGLVKGRRQGKYIFYSLVNPNTMDFFGISKSLVR
jgi:DNA-binding transcriptional ArsR family regulator